MPALSGIEDLAIERLRRCYTAARAFSKKVKFTRLKEA